MKNSFFYKNRRILAVFVCFLVILPIILSNCDIFSDSVDEFIGFSTGTADIVDITVTSIGKEKLITRMETWIIDPNENNLNGIITFEIKINNPNNYDLEITPVISEFIGDNWDKTSSPQNRPITVSSIQGKPDLRKIQIGNNSSGNQVTRGDSFRIRLDLATSDGSRNFKSFTDIPQIIYDSRLLPASELDVEDPPLGSGYGNNVVWKTQGENTHKGINRLSITFASRADDSVSKTLEYAFDKSELKWKLQNGASYDVENYGVLKYIAGKDGVGDVKFELPFPFLMGVDASNFNEEFSVIINLRDKNDQSSMAGLGAHPATYLDDLSIWYQDRLPGEDLSIQDINSPYYISSWKFTNKNMISATLIVPNSVKRVQFRAVKSKERGDNGIAYGDNQEVYWGGATIDEPTKSFSLAPGVEKNIKMEIIWKDPESNSSEDNPSMTYTFKIFRLKPNEDSTLKALEIRNAAPGGVSYNYGTFDGTNKKEYTVNVPSGVTDIIILGDYLSTSEIYNNKGRPDPATIDFSNPAWYNDPSWLGGPTYGKIIQNPDDASSTDPYPPYFKTIQKLIYKDYFQGYIPKDWDPGSSDDNEYFPDDKNFPLYIIQNGWQYPLSKGKNDFEFNVRSESNSNVVVTTYNIHVIRTDESANPNAKIDRLTISGGGNTLLQYYAEGDVNAVHNRFNQEDTDYTVEVPSGVNNLSLSVRPLTNAEIREITYINISGTPPSGSVTYTPPIVRSSTSEISLGTINIPDGKKLLTFTVYSGGINSTPRNYTVTLIKRDSSIVSLNTDLKGESNILKVTRSNNPAGASGYKYEVAYRLHNSTPLAVDNIPEKAAKLPGLLDYSRFNSAPDPVIIGGLENFVKYNVWVRAVSSTNIPGDWVQSANTGVLGTPGPAELTGITPSPGTLVPTFDANIKNYTLTISSGTDSLSFGCTIDTRNTQEADNPTYTRPDEGKINSHTITAYSPDGKTPEPYKITITRGLSAPSNLEVVSAIDGEVDLSWTEIAGASYEVYYSENNLSDANVEAQAHKWSGAITGTTTKATAISPLTDATPYYFWVHGVKDIAGAFAKTSATPKSTLRSLKNVSVNAGGVISPKFSSNEDVGVVEDYTIALPASSGAAPATITGTKQNTGQGTNPVSGSNSTVTFSVDPGNGTKVDRSILVWPHSDNSPTPTANTKTYNFTIYRKLAKPSKTGSFAITEQSNSIIVDGWVPVTGLTYEIFCGTDSNENNAEKWAGAEINISPTKGTAKVPGLQNGTPYYLWVRAVLTTGDGFFIPGEFLLLNTNDASPVTPNNGNAGITLNLDPIPTAEDTDYNLTNNLALDHLNLLENTSLTINIPVAISNYEWFIDGIKAVNVTGLVSGVGTKNLTVYARYFTAGPRPNGVQHTISARIQINGNWYSKNVVFTVYAAP